MACTSWLRSFPKPHSPTWVMVFFILTGSTSYLSIQLGTPCSFLSTPPPFGAWPRGTHCCPKFGRELLDKAFLEAERQCAYHDLFSKLATRGRRSVPVPHLLSTHRVRRLAEPSHSCHCMTQHAQETAGTGSTCSRLRSLSAFPKSLWQAVPKAPSSLPSSRAQTLLSSINCSHFTPLQQSRCLFSATWSHLPP